ncbi:NAD(P)-dependent oxidoreductase [Bailinhaonella thermotolerans]|uniref:NAD(P)-dependent oxidoreductase n=1 Tax=Bailinhaonella thermotolerans TaxID=1070861 RepID=A0A3A4B0Z9_9ACTN|nr:NAD(P)-binding domain-containing protein [Bailinhaonella thermotolerans]RJL31707.1 NAD(P)-dependent oxidoreductase [Bailinhaonella thermotolerans]
MSEHAAPRNGGPAAPGAREHAAKSVTAVRAGFVGLGQMGEPMARRLLGRDGGLVVCDVRPEAVRPFAEAGARTGADPAAVAAAADVILVMVRDDAQVREVVAAMLPAAARGTVIAIHSTIADGTAEELAARAGPYGVEIADAPVSGGFMGAHEGNLAVMLGASEAAAERCRAVFGAWAGLIVRVGPPGAGTRAKLARNLLQFVAFAAAFEAQRLAEAAGVHLRDLARVVRHSDAVTGGPGAIMIRDTTAPAPEGDPLRDILLHTRALAEKDLSLALDLAADLDVDVPLARISRARFARDLGVPHP